MNGTTARLLLRVVAVPLPGGNIDSTREVVLGIVSRLGMMEKSTVAPYYKPAGSFMVRATAHCAGDPNEILESALGLCGGTGWHREDGGLEPEAIWAPAEGLLPPIAIDVAWAHVAIVAARSA